MGVIHNGLIKHEGRAYYIVLSDKEKGEANYKIKINKSSTALEVIHGKWTARGIPDKLSQHIGMIIKRKG